MLKAMKRNLLLTTGIFLILNLNAQFRSFGLTVGAGHTIVDVEEAVDWENLEEWDHIGMIIKASGEYELRPDLFAVGEVGSNRLYYWEYRWSDGYYSGNRWRSEWTTNLGISIKKYVSEAFYLQAGPSVHIFNDGSGTVFGWLAALGYDISLTDQLRIPVGFRVEPVFGNALPISLLVHTGIKYSLAR